MELIPSNREPTAVAIVSQEPWAIAIRRDYGDLKSFSLRFRPEAKIQKHCANNVGKAISSGLPSFARVVKTYGEDGITQLLAAHLTEAILRLGEDRDVDPADIQFTAEAMVSTDRGKTLNWASIVGFFFKLKCGEFDLWGKVTPRRILEAYRKWTIDQAATEARIYYELEHAKKRADEAEAARQPSGAVALASFMEAQGLPPDTSIAAWAMHQANEQNARRNLIRDFVEALSQLIRVIAFIADYQAQHSTK